jgi:hypothetical protein
MTAVPPPAPFIAPSRNERAWEQLRFRYSGIDGIAPGLVTISGADIEDKYDIKEAQAQDGATTERKGELARKFDSIHRLSDVPPPPGTYQPVEGVDVVDDHVQWTAWQWILRSAMKSKPPQAISVRHPKLALKEITAAVPTKIVGPDVDGEGFTVFVISWLVYAPVEKSGGPGGVSGDPDESPDGRTETDDAIDKAKQEIDALQDEWEQL